MRWGTDSILSTRGVHGWGDQKEKSNELHLQLLVWYCFTVFAFFGSLLLGINFILGVLEIPSRPVTGKVRKT